jgi:hypothetical protein
MAVGACEGSAAPSAWSCHTGHRNCRQTTPARHCWPWPLHSSWPPCVASRPTSRTRDCARRRSRRRSPSLCRFPADRTGRRADRSHASADRPALAPSRRESSGLAADCGHRAGPAPAGQPDVPSLPRRGAGPNRSVPALDERRGRPGAVQPPTRSQAAAAGYRQVAPDVHPPTARNACGAGP